jgi:ABC-type bacteriocin/lantibiotic exporter with double-glycine peptidase domain
MEYATSYGGVVSGQWGGVVQTGQETCGHAALAFFLSGIGFPATEGSIIRETGTSSMLSLADMDRVFTSRGLKTQLLNVDPGYFKKRPTAAILHFSSQHFVVFLQEEKGEPVIFDPAYGQVFVPWKTLLRRFSGYMLYVYQ